jgi:miniconductance mechanosensitive channel
VIENLFSWCYPLLSQWGLPEPWSSYISMFLNLLMLMVIVYIIYILNRIVIITILAFIAKRTRTKFDNLLISSKSAKYFSHLVPLIFVQESVPVILKAFVYWETIFAKLLGLYIVILILWIIRTLLNALKIYLKSNPKYSDKPIESFIQVLMIVLWGFGIIYMILFLFNTSITSLLATFGAISAIIILIFRDTILGFASSIQVSVNDLVRIGDWITVEKFGADGEVIEINLATVLIRNFDHTTTTIPTYSLLSSSFRNWRGMYSSQGRRIKRSMLIRVNSIRFIREQELADMMKIEFIAPYIITKNNDIQQFNKRFEVDTSLPINGRQLTNIGLFRKYVQTYLEHHPGINKDLMILCRQLQPTPQGLPLEIYAYCKDKRFENYEHVVADIMDHLMAAIIYFDLFLYEMPAGKSPLEE